MNNSIQTKHMTARNGRGFIKSSKGFYIGDITDLRKAIWYLNRYIEYVNKQDVQSVHSKENKT